MAGYAKDDISNCLIGDIITVYVGPKHKRYSVHKAFLTQCEWFSKKISYTGSQVASQAYMNLPEEDPKIFELLINWLYRRNLKAISTDPDSEEVAKEEAALYVDLYTRACVWEIRDLQNELIDRLRLRETCEYGFFPPHLISKIYKSTSIQSPLRSYVVDSFIFKGVGWNASAKIPDLDNVSHTLTRRRALKKQWDAGNQVFALDCYEALFQLCDKSNIHDPDRKIGCVYHTHKGGEKCKMGVRRRLKSWTATSR